MKDSRLMRASEVLKLHTTEKQLPALATSNIAEVFDDEKSAKKAAEICAKNLKNLFVKMKNEDPLKDQFDLYWEAGWRDAIQELLKLAKDPMDRMRLFDYLDMKLKNLWLKWSRPSYTYFSENSYDANYYVSFLHQDMIKEREVNKRSKKCAQNLIDLYNKFKLENEDKETLYMNVLSEWWKNIEDFLEWVSGWDIKEMFGYLSQELDAKWYIFNRPSYTYFENKNDGSAWISISEKAHDVEKAA